MSLLNGWTRNRNGMREQEALDRMADGGLLDQPLDETLGQALVDFKLSVHAWSEAELGRPRMLAQGVRQRSWRLAASVALGLTLVAGGEGPPGRRGFAGQGGQRCIKGNAKRHGASGSTDG